MFDRFGEFDSEEEINRAAEKLKEAGDTEKLLALAEENGIDKEDAQAYIDGEEKALCSRVMAAMGKMAVEEKDLEIKGILSDWTGYIKEMCISETGMAAAVRKKGKRLSECMAMLIQFAFENKVQVSDKIVSITKVTVNGKKEAMRRPLYLGFPNRAEARRIIKEYYMK